jgi:cardiolipin synthase
MPEAPNTGQRAAPGQPGHPGQPCPPRPEPAQARCAPAGLPERVLTVPNAISVARRAGVPAFLWLVLGPHADGWAVALLAAAGISDWLDGKLARAWNQQSRLGRLLDPAADRLYIAATLAGLAIRGIVPWWLVGLLAGRELVLGAALLALRRQRYEPLQVSFVGKAATLCLLYAFPLLFLGAHVGPWALAAQIIGWAFAVWGSALYWWAAVLYLRQTWALLSEARGQQAGRAGNAKR